MEKKVCRKPIGNFFIKKSLQIRFITKIVVAALASTLVSTGSLILVYYLRYNTVIVYQLDKLSQELSREHIIFLIFPTLLISAIVSILVSFGVGIYASRKYAVPIYKLEQWASLLRKGKMSAQLRFREKEEMRELSTNCNLLAAEIREKFMKIRIQAELLKQADPSSPTADEILKVLSDLELEQTPIEVSTSFYTISNVEKK